MIPVAGGNDHAAGKVQFDYRTRYQPQHRRYNREAEQVESVGEDRQGNDQEHFVNAAAVRERAGETEEDDVYAQKAVRKVNHPGYPFGNDLSQNQQQDVGNQESDNNRIGDDRLLAEQPGAWYQPVQDERPEEYRGNSVAGDTECDQRNHRRSHNRVIARFRGGDTLYRSVSVLLGILRRSPGLAAADELSHTSSSSRHCTDNRRNQGRFDNCGQYFEQFRQTYRCILTNGEFGTVPASALGFHFNRLYNHLIQCYESDQCGEQPHPGEQQHGVERKTQCP